jgi:TetR/AcrR family transcriptional repressor of nem operon
MTRAEQKERTHRRIVDQAARQFREGGLSGAAVQGIMAAAGLTHGGFYSHFDSKAELMAEAIAAALADARERWLASVDGPPGPKRLKTFLSRYLSRAHRDAPGAGCPLSSISADVARAPAVVRRAYGDELRKMIESMETGLDHAEGDDADARAVGTLALCVGGLLLARAVDDRALSDDILQACRRFGADAGETRQP